VASKFKVFIDGQAGTIGLRMRELLAGRAELELLEIGEPERKDPRARAAMLDRADVSILCLPDDAAREAVALITNPDARVIDGSSAHRVAEGWVYGLPELAPAQRTAIADAKRVGNPGCWPTCVALLVRPLIDAGLLPADAPLAIHGVSGYSGGGKSMIERWEDPSTQLLALPYPAPYALDRRHKHVPEMMRYGGLTQEPVFMPSVGPFRCGMRVEIPLHTATLPARTTASAICEVLQARYAGERFIDVQLLQAALDRRERVLDPTAQNGSNRVALRVLPHPSGHVVLVALIDNLGKGAAGAAVQSLNLMLGLAEHAGLA
jgi:N-acetyl-gamma-glutamyl-phosphate reductase